MHTDAHLEGVREEGAGKDQAFGRNPCLPAHVSHLRPLPAGDARQVAVDKVVHQRAQCRQHHPVVEQRVLLREVVRVGDRAHVGAREFA